MRDIQMLCESANGSAMLNIKKRIDLLQELLDEDTEQSLTYAALEARLTLEYLCYERFKLTYSYLSLEDLKSWQPRHVIKQVSEDIDSNIDKEFTLSISKQSTDGKILETKEDFEALEYVTLGTQSALNLSKIHTLWHGLSNLALHIPVPSIDSGNINIYQNGLKIRNKVESVIQLLKGIKGNLLMAGPLGKVFSFECQACSSSIKRPIEKLKKPIVANCINPKCEESYLLEPIGSDDEIKVTRRIIRFKCQACYEDLEVPGNIFKNLKFNQQLNIKCGSCQTCLELIMRPLMKTVDEKDSHCNQINKGQG